MHLKNSALSFLLFLFLTGWGFSSYSGEIAVAIPHQVQLNLSAQIVNNFNHLTQNLSSQMLTAEQEAQIMAELRQITAEVKAMENARYVVKPVIASRGNLYFLAASVVGSALFDYLINYLENEKNNYFHTIPPSSCKYLIDYPCNNVIKKICNGSGGDLSCTGVDLNTIVNWSDNGTGACFADFSTVHKSLKPGECVDVVTSTDGFFDCTRSYYTPGNAPSDWLNCPNQPKKQYPPFVIPPINPDDVSNLVPSDYTNKIPFQDSPNVKTPQDITPPLSSPDGSAIFDIPDYSPDGVFSPDFTDPNNPVPDIPLSDPNVKISYHITDPNTGQSYDYTDKSISNPISNDKQEDYTYNPTDKDLDTKIDVPEKKDLKTLILSNIDAIKSKFSFDNSCGGGACSFTVSVFGSNATIDFCQFADLFGTIGTVILVFSYFYAFFIITRGN